MMIMVAIVVADVIVKELKSNRFVLAIILDYA